MAGEPVGSGGGQSADRTKAVAPLLAGFPRGTVPTANVLLSLATLNTEAEQREDTASFRLDHRFTNNQSFYARLLYSDGRVDTPDRTVTPRRVLATQHPMNFVANHQSIFGTSVINELKIGYNRPQYDANAFGPSGYDPTQVSLSGTVTSQSIDARGTTGIARSGLLVRATSNASTNGQAYDPRSISLSDAMTITRGGHTFKVGGEYRNIASKFQFLGSTEITYNSINAFIDNTPAQVAVALDSPFFTPQQFYAHRVRAGHLACQQPADPRARPALRLLLGGEGEGQSLQAVLHRGQRLRRQRRAVLQPRQEQLRAAAVGRLPAHAEDGAARRLRPLLRAGPVRGPHSADRELHRAAPGPVNRCAGTGVPGRPRALSQPPLGPRLHARSSRRVQRPVPA